MNTWEPKIHEKLQISQHIDRQDLATSVHGEHDNEHETIDLGGKAILAKTWLRNLAREHRAEDRAGMLMIRTNEKSDRSIEAANPHFGGAGVEVEGALFVYLGWGIGWRQDFNADFGSASEKKRILVNLGPILSEPGNISSLDSIGSRNGTFSESGAFRQQLREDGSDSGLAARVTRSGRWTHNDASVPICFDAIGQFRQPRIVQDCLPPGKVEDVLRLEIRQL